jgi:serine/threonine-protein kinase
MDTKEAMTRAERAAKDALDLDETLPEAHTSLATVNLKYHWNWQEAEAHFKRALELKPDYAPAHYGYSNLLIITGRQNEAVVQSEIARDLDPFSPATALGVCKALYFARRFGQATNCFDKMVHDHPKFSAGKYSRGLMYLQQAKYPEAIAIFEELYRQDRRLAGAALGYTYGTAGRFTEARQVLAEMQVLSKPTNLPPQELALIYLGLGEMDNAFRLLEQSAEQHFAPFATLPVDPLFEKLRSDPRFIDIIRRHHLPAM